MQEVDGIQRAINGQVGICRTKPQQVLLATAGLSSVSVKIIMMVETVDSLRLTLSTLMRKARHSLRREYV